MSVHDYWRLEMDRNYMSSLMHGNIWYRDQDRERREFGKWLCKEAEDDDDRWWSPMRYVSQQEIDEYVDYIDNIHCTNPTVHIQHASGCWGSWELFRPGYYRVEHRKEPKDWWWSMSSRTGFPENERNAVCKHFRHVRREKRDKFLDYFLDIKKRKDQEELERLEREREERQKNHSKRWEARERYSRTRGVTPDVETTAFFQALATGSLIK